jgi:dipeptidyl aminopeptidase/acylaminoacyl peptidase
VAFLAFADAPAQLIVIDSVGGPEMTLPADPPPSRTHPMGGGVLAWSPDGDELAYIGKDGGLWRQSLDGRPSAPVLAAPHDASLAAPVYSPDGSRLAVVQDERFIRIVALDGSSDTSLAPDGDFAFDPVWLDDATIAWHCWTVPDMPWDHSRFVSAPADGSAPSSVLIDVAGAQVAQLRPCLGRHAYLCDADGWLNVWLDGAPLAPENSEHGGPTWGMGIRTIAWSPNGSWIAFTRNEAGFGRLCVVDVASRAIYDVAKAVHAGVMWQGNHLTAIRTGARTPNVLVSYDTSDTDPSQWQRTVLARGPVVGIERDCVEPELVEVPADDGTRLPARLYRRSPDPRPLLVWIHGGPTDQWMVSFHARIAFFLTRGWAVLVVDHRGSTGSGRSFAQALQGRWGELDVSDVVAAIDEAHRRGWSRPESTVVIGGSAGGFAAQGVAAHSADRIAAAVAVYPVCDLVALAQTTSRFETHYTDGLVGPLPEAHALYEQRSPLHLAQSIRVPLLLLHGSDDKVVPVSQSVALADRIRTLGGAVEFHVYQGEGHGWKRAETLMDELQRVEVFLALHVAIDQMVPKETVS